MRSAAVGILCVRRGISHTRSRSWTATDRGLCFTPTLARRYFLYRGYSLQEKFENISSSALRYLCRAFEIRICCVNTIAPPTFSDVWNKIEYTIFESLKSFPPPRLGLEVITVLNNCFLSGPRVVPSIYSKYI